MRSKSISPKKEDVEQVEGGGLILLSELELESAILRSLPEAQPFGKHKHMIIIRLQTLIHERTGVWVAIEELWNCIERFYSVEVLDDMETSSSVSLPSSPILLSPLLPPSNRANLLRISRNKPHPPIKQSESDGRSSDSASLSPPPSESDDAPTSEVAGPPLTSKSAGVINSIHFKRNFELPYLGLEWEDDNEAEVFGGFAYPRAIAVEGDGDITEVEMKGWGGRLWEQEVGNDTANLGLEGLDNEDITETKSGKDGDDEVGDEDAEDEGGEQDEDQTKQGIVETPPTTRGRGRARTSTSTTVKRGAARASTSSRRESGSTTVTLPPTQSKKKGRPSRKGKEPTPSASGSDGEEEDEEEEAEAPPKRGAAKKAVQAPVASGSLKAVKKNLGGRPSKGSVKRKRDSGGTNREPVEESDVEEPKRDSRRRKK